MRSRVRIGLALTSAVTVLAGGLVVTSALAETSRRPVKSSAQTIYLGSASAPARGAKAKDKTVKIRRGHTRAFSAYGVTWAHGSGAVEVVSRVYGDGGWSSWQELDVDPPAKRGTRAGTRLVWTGPSSGIEVAVTSVSGAHPRHVRVDLIDPGQAPADAEAATLSTTTSSDSADAQAADMPTILRRADWGADESKMTWDPEYADKLVAIVLHHTATTNSYSAGEVPGIIRSIYHYQAVTLDWGDIGYNVLVDRFGRLWEGRYGGLDKPLIGGHAGGFNTGTSGIAMIGHHSDTRVADAVIEGAARYAAWRFTPDRIDPRETTTITGGPSSKYPDDEVTITVPTIFPHRETSNTECPGARGMDALQPIRDTAWRYWRPSYPNRGPYPDRTDAEEYDPRPRTSWR